MCEETEGEGGVSREGGRPALPGRGGLCFLSGLPPARPADPELLPAVSRPQSRGKAEALTELGVGLPKVRLADNAIAVLVDAAEGLRGGGHSLRLGRAPTPGKARGGEGS